MEEFRLDGLTVKEHLLILAEEGNRKFTEGLHPGVEHVLGIRLPALRKLAARIAKADWESYLDTADGFYMEERMLQGMVPINSIKSGGLWIIWYRIFRVDTENRYSYSLFHPIKK